MKQMVCEMCGSTDLVKQDGMFVCQVCGTKYSVEDAKKMMIEGTVDVQGTVKVDNSSFVERYIANARRARQKEDWEEVEKYYNLVEQNDPTNIEAIFYSAYGKTRMSMIDPNVNKREMICKAFSNSISVIDDNYDITDAENNREIIQWMSDDLLGLYGTPFVYKPKNADGTNTMEDFTTYWALGSIATSFVESIENILKEDDQLEYRKVLHKHYAFLSQFRGVSIPDRKDFAKKANAIAQEIKDKDASFEAPTIVANESFHTPGCYVATAVYGSYDCPEVWTLRRFRDFELAESWYGRAFIHTYYAISPTLVKWFGETTWFKKMWKGKLDRMVTNLQRKGFESTPYEDREW